jgi:hypothetical protein
MKRKLKPIFTENDLKLLQVSSEEMQKSFVDILFEQLGSENHLTKVLYAQLHIESLINAILENGTYNHSKLNLDKLTFGHKINLAVAQGFVDLDVEPSLLKLGSIRNKMAHNISAKLEMQDELDFLNVLKQSRLKEKIQKGKGKWGDNFSNGIMTLWFYLFEQMLKIMNQREALFEVKRQIVTTEPEQLISNGPKSFLIGINKIIF